jgi:hypothetical protein
MFMPLALALLALARTGPAVRALGAVAAAGTAAGAAFALAGGIAGYLIARFGLRSRARHAAFAGLLGAFELWALVLLSGGFQAAFLGASTLLMLGAVGAAFCALGAWLNRRPRDKATRKL